MTMEKTDIETGRRVLVIFSSHISLKLEKQGVYLNLFIYLSSDSDGFMKQYRTNGKEHIIINLDSS